MVLYANKFLQTNSFEIDQPPILSVNLGTLGFLSQFAKEEFSAGLQSTFDSADSTPADLNLLCVPKVTVEVFSSGKVG